MILKKQQILWAGFFLLIFWFFNPIFAEEEKFGAKALSHIKVLSSPDFQGRKTGTEGGRKTEEYVAEKFKEFGLQPLQGSFLQKFVYPSYNLLPGGILELMIPGNSPLRFNYNQDYYFLAGSGEIDVTGEVVFAGYGICAPQALYDDFEGLELSGKIVLAMEGIPPGNPKKYGDRAAWDANKAKLVREKGASALILFSDPQKLAVFPEYKVWGVSADGYLGNFAIAKIHLTALNEILEGTGKFAVDLKRTIDRTGRPASFSTGKIIHLRCHSSYNENCEGANVIGIIPGTDPALKTEIVTLGGHIDGGGVDPDGAIFYGAEDDASGTSVILEIAERLTRDKFSPLRTIMLAGWGAEEQGGIGSKHYLDNPFFPLEKTVYNFCVDNVGWGEGEFWLFSALNFPDEFAVIRGGIDAGLIKSFIPRGLGGSDSYFFQQKGIPALFAHTTQSQPYNHRPLDTWQLINPRALENVTLFMYQALKTAANYQGKLINPDRYGFFIHRDSTIVDLSEDMFDILAGPETARAQRATAEYSILRKNGIDLCVQNISGGSFKESAVKMNSIRNHIQQFNPAISILEREDQLQEAEEGRNFLIALKLNGVASFDSDPATLEILKELGARILCLDLSSNLSPDYEALFDSHLGFTSAGDFLLKKSEELGLLIELKNPSRAVVEKICSNKRKPVLVTLTNDRFNSIKEFSAGFAREKIFYTVPLDVSAEKSGPDKMKLLKELGLFRFSMLNPFSYTEAGELKKLTVDLIEANFTLEDIKGILGKNFIILFEACCEK